MTQSLNNSSSENPNSTTVGMTTAQNVSVSPFTVSPSASLSNMTTDLVSTVEPTNQTECTDLFFLGECVSTGKEYFSFIVGSVAVVVWLAANYKLVKKLFFESLDSHMVI